MGYINCKCGKRYTTYHIYGWSDNSETKSCPECNPDWRSVLRKHNDHPYFLQPLLEREVQLLKANNERLSELHLSALRVGESRIDEIESLKNQVKACEKILARVYKFQEKLKEEINETIASPDVHWTMEWCLKAFKEIVLDAKG